MINKINKMPSTTVNADLLKERKKCTFNVAEFSDWWNGGPKRNSDRKKLENYFLNDPELNCANAIPDSYLSHKELYERGIEIETKMMLKSRELAKQEGKDVGEVYRQLREHKIWLGLIKNGIATSLHAGMFLPTIMGQGTREQQDEWIPRIVNYQMIGTYAQTELGHGTFLRGLETRADYDPKTQEFVLNSPTITSHKWWPGGLGHTANYAIVMSQLYTNGENRGVQPFIVQLRDEETHMPMPGVHIGEIGAKLGFKSVNNGFLGLKNVRIPRKNMLMKNAQVLEDGTFIKAKTNVLTYGTMTLVRVWIVADSASHLAQAATIATRYSAVRRQSPINPNEPEPQIIDHITQQLKLIPQIAKAVVHKLTAESLQAIHHQVTAELYKGELDRLPELHAISCCLKAVAAFDSTAGVEVCRLSCGGHGYMECSNFPRIYSNATAGITYEGENTVLLLQTSRYLMKAWRSALNGKQQLAPSVAYLREAVNQKQFANWNGSVQGIAKAFQFVAANRIRLAYEHLEARKQAGRTQEQAANETGIELTQAAEMHGRAYFLETGLTEIEKHANKLSPAIGIVLRQLFEVYAIETSLNRLGDLLRFANLTENDVIQLQSRLEILLAQLRPNAVGIVDGFDFHDGILSSALGAYDGNVYERIFAEAKKSPLNQEPVNESFHKYLKPFMKSNL